MLLSLHIDKLGMTFERDTDTLPVATREYLWRNGYSQRLRDCHASIKRSLYPAGDAGKAAWQADVGTAVATVLEQFDSGNVPGTRQPADPAVVKFRVQAAKAKELGLDAAAILDAAIAAASAEKEAA